MLSGECPRTHTATNKGKPYGWVWQGITNTKIYSKTVTDHSLQSFAKKICLVEVMDADAA